MCPNRGLWAKSDPSRRLIWPTYFGVVIKSGPPCCSWSLHTNVTAWGYLRPRHVFLSTKMFPAMSSSVCSYFRGFHRNRPTGVAQVVESSLGSFMRLRWQSEDKICPCTPCQQYGGKQPEGPMRFFKCVRPSSLFPFPRVALVESAFDTDIDLDSQLFSVG